MSARRTAGRILGPALCLGLAATAVPTAVAEVDDPAAAPTEAVLVDQTREKGLWEPLLGMFAHTAASADVNGDGYLDLYVGGFYQQMPWDKFFRFGTRGATEISPDRLLLGGPDGFTPDDTFPELRDGNSSGSSFADFDGDGDLDLLVSQYYPYEYVNNVPPPTNGQSVVVLENVGGSFAEPRRVAPEIGARTVAVADYDADGNLDFFVVEDIYYQPQLGPSSSRLYLGNGDLTFDEATAESGLPANISGLGASATDLNGDHAPDLLVSGTLRKQSDPAGAGTYGRARLFVNDGSGSFTEADASMFAMRTGGWNDESAGMAVADLNRDGRSDVVIGAHPYPGLTTVWPQPIHIYLNEGNDADGNPRFRDVTAETGIGAIDSKSAHITLADTDQDGWLDIVSGVSVKDGTTPAVFKHLGLSDGVPQFATPAGLGSERVPTPEISQWENAKIPRYWPTGVNGDFDRDGDVDAFMAEWFPELPSRYFDNRTERNGNWLTVKLPTTDLAPGTTVRIYDRPGNRPKARDLVYSREFTPNESYGGGVPYELYAGVGDARVVAVELIAPHTGERTLLKAVRTNREVTVTLP
ncbi:FG-GAP repeat domain-containing protein [Nocardioides sp. BYT-33-1]|uniref:FG-GAP repeat domain-containing protein n=1 Tax=Nocardioides sp. BYT-33-1 TaxID=3416952 RepID=UPI003F53729E